MDTNKNLSQAYSQIKHVIEETEKNGGRMKGSVLLLAVSKGQTVASMREAFALGIRDFAENYWQEAEKKIMLLHSLPMIWHFIGPIQSNKVKEIARTFDWVHTLHRVDIARKLSQHRPPERAPLNVCLQIQLVEEERKSGIPMEQAGALAKAVCQLSHLSLRGLMTLPPPSLDPEASYSLFLKLRELMDSLNHELGLNMDTLSMGMSADFIPAIEAGATIIRLGTAIFGPRSW